MTTASQRPAGLGEILQQDGSPRADVSRGGTGDCTEIEVLGDDLAAIWNRTSSLLSAKLPRHATRRGPARPRSRLVRRRRKRNGHGLARGSLIVEIRPWPMMRSSRRLKASLGRSKLSVGRIQ